MVYSVAVVLNNKLPYICCIFWFLLGFAWVACSDDEPGEVDAGEDAFDASDGSDSSDAGGDDGDAGYDYGYDYDYGDGDGNGDDGGGDEARFCPDIAGGIVFRMEAVFEASEQEPTRTFLIPCGADEIYSRIVLDFDFYHAGYYEPDPDGAHGLFQLIRGTVWRSNLYGFMTMRGPTSNLHRVISNIDLAAGETIRLQTTHWVPPDRDYHMQYIYDASVPERRLILMSGDQELFDISDNNAVSEIRTLAPGFELILATDLAEPGTGPEVPMHGWRFSNLCLRIEP